MANEIFQIPVRNDLPAYDFDIELEGTTYNLQFTFNSRMNSWFMSISDVNGNPILQGVRLFTAWVPLHQYANELLPPGQFVIIDTAGEDKDPDLDNFGDRVQMFYQESV